MWTGISYSLPHMHVLACVCRDSQSLPKCSWRSKLTIWRKAEEVDNYIGLGLGGRPKTQPSYDIDCICGHAFLVKRINCMLCRTTKTTFVASVAFLLDNQGRMPLSSVATYFTIIVFFVASKLLYFLRRIDCFEPVEKLIGYVFFGGLFDDIEMRLTRLMQRRRHSNDDDNYDRPKQQ